MTTLREEIAEKFNDCMGYWEGIKVPDHEQGHRAIDYSDQVLKLFTKRLDSTIEDIKRDMEFISKQNLKDNHNGSVQLHHIYKLREMLK